MDTLVVIDVQQGMFGFPGYPIHDGEAVVSRIQRLVETARAAAVPVVFVQHAGPPGDTLAPGTPGFDLRAELVPAANEPVIVKRSASAFQDTNLEALLKATGADHLVICGMQTEECVNATTRAAAEHGYRVTLASDAHTTTDAPGYKAPQIIAYFNKTLGDGIATVVPASEIAFAA